MREPAQSRWPSRCSILGALLLLCAVACGKASRDGSDGEAGGGTSPGSLGGSTGMVAGQGGTGGSGGSVPLPNATEEEQAILEPLFTDPAEIDGADMQQLIEMGADIGIARGYAMCRCAAVAAPELDLMGCAVAEAGALTFTRSPPRAPEPLLNQDLARCLQEESVERPWFADALRCELRWHQEDGRAWLELCALPGFETPFDCPGVDDAARNEFSFAISMCQYVAYCDDGARVAPGRRCDGTRECPDWSDERSCFDIEGQDMVKCGDEIAKPWDFTDFCSLTSCSGETEPPLCNDTEPRLTCPDGTELNGNVLCDRNDDCADGADEHYCLR